MRRQWLQKLPKEPLASGQQQTRSFQPAVSVRQAEDDYHGAFTVALLAATSAFYDSRQENIINLLFPSI